MEPQSAATSTLDTIVPYQSIPDIFPHLYSKKSWTWAVKQRHSNGLARAFRKVGRKLFVNTNVLAACIDSQSDLSDKEQP
jgi:hypothetical protein